MASRRIALLVSALETGGAERVAVTLANAWAARGDTVDLVATYPHSRGCAFPVSPGVQLTFTGAGRGGALALSRAARLLHLRRHLQAFAPDVVVAFLTNVNVAAVVATAGLGLPTLIREATDPREAPVSRALALQRFLTYRFADIVTVQTEALRTELGARWLGVRRLRVVANPVPAVILALPPPALLPRTGTGVVAAAGRLSQEKGFAGLVQTFLHRAPPGWQLRIFGDGPERLPLQGLIDAHGAGDRVRLMGNVADLWTQLGAVDLFVLSSRFEGFPNVLLEAMALGLPCVSFDCRSGPREMSDGGRCAALVPAGDWLALGAALRHLMDNPPARAALGAAAADFVRQRYSLAQVLAGWDALFDEAGARR